MKIIIFVITKMITVEFLIILAHEARMNKPKDIPEARTIYVTLQDRGNPECFRLDIPGREWQMLRR